MSDPDAHERFMRLFLQHELAILRSVLVCIPQLADARDVVQETAVALWKHFPSYQPERPFINWACGFARIEVRRFLRTAHRRALLSEQAAAAVMASDETFAPAWMERERQLADCRARLPSEHARLLDGYYFEEATVETLAKRYGRTTEATYKLLQRIRSALLDCMDRKIAEAAQ